MISWRGVAIDTIGHSSRALEELLSLLQAFQISTVVDVRTIPRSRHNPQFGQDKLRKSLRSRGLGYVHIPELGGLRRPRKDSPNVGWRNQSFRGYADYMLTEGFETGLQKLRDVVMGGHGVLMCAEAVPWRCHRSLIADALTARGARVEHIVSSLTRKNPHKIASFARVEGARVTYPAEDDESLHQGQDGLR